MHTHHTDTHMHIASFGEILYLEKFYTQYNTLTKNTCYTVKPKTYSFKTDDFLPSIMSKNSL